MNRRLWSSIIAAALVLGTLSGCNTNIEGSVPQISTGNPALASVTHSSSNSDTSSSKSSSSSSTSTKSAVEKVDDKLMETLDGYEDFFKEYTQYIKNYKNEDSSKLQEYAKKSEDITELLEKYDTSGFNKKEEIYLADVKYRIDKMLASIKNRLPEWNDESGRYEMSTSSTSKRPVATSPFSSSYKPSPSSSSAAPSSPITSSESEAVNEPAGSATESTVITDYSLPEIVDVPEPDTSSLFTDYTRKWAYNQLNSAQQVVYARLFESAKNKTGDINVTDLNLSVDDTTKAY